jgi:hypothetical protein
MQKVANRNVWDFGWEMAHKAVSRRPPTSLSTIVARTHMYAYDADVWDLSIVQGPFSVAPCQTLIVRFATVPSLYAVAYNNPGLGVSQLLSLLSAANEGRTTDDLTQQGHRLALEVRAELQRVCGSDTPHSLSR